MEETKEKTNVGDSFLSGKKVCQTCFTLPLIALPYKNEIFKP
jgi:hypothetical protein